MGCLITEYTHERSIAFVSIPGACLGTKHELCLCSTCPDTLPCSLFTSTDVHIGKKTLGISHQGKPDIMGAGRVTFLLT